MWGFDAESPGITRLPAGMVPGRLGCMAAASRLEGDLKYAGG